MDDIIMMGHFVVVVKRLRVNVWGETPTSFLIFQQLSLGPKLKTITNCIMDVILIFNKVINNFTGNVVPKLDQNMDWGRTFHS